ncbi:hypothetical protein HRbin12_01169 [bacterium HR12]|nr:hypothetical protein HRbin12_01169 [bacterium HR12]
MTMMTADMSIQKVTRVTQYGPEPIRHVFV